jgi:hypothetical protein
MFQVSVVFDSFFLKHIFVILRIVVLSTCKYNSREAFGSGIQIFKFSLSQIHLHFSIFEVSIFQNESSRRSCSAKAMLESFRTVSP